MDFAAILYPIIDEIGPGGAASMYNKNSVNADETCWRIPNRTSRLISNP